MPIPFTRHELKHPRWWSLLIIGSCLGYAVTALTRLPLWGLPVVTAAWLGLAAWLGWGAPRHPASPRSFRVWSWSLVPIALWGLYIYLSESFGIVDLSAVFFHLQAGMTDHGGVSRVGAALFYTFSMAALFVSFIWLTGHDSLWRRIDPFLALVLLASNPLLYGVTQRGAAIVTDDGAWLERQYVEPMILDTPVDPPNLLFLYLESIERTYADRERFGDAYADLDAIGERGLVFEGVRQLDNTGWTMAGMIASQCGTPLMPAGLLHDRQFSPLERVVPGIDCLGDLLSEHGYRLSYLGGASTAFAGKGLFYKDHGFDTILGREDLQPRLDDPEYLNNWGLYDDSLYDFTVEEIRRLDAEADGPWGVVNLSITGHAPGGYPAQACLDRQGEFDGQDILFSVECSAWLARRLVERLEREGLLDNTLVVLASDHLTMRVSAWEELIHGERDNTFILLGPDIPVGRISRKAAMIDVFPTILEALGFTIDWHRAGLGVSLLSGEPTLAEEHGEDVINARMREETALQQRLWEGLTPQQQESQAEPQEQVLETPKDAIMERPDASRDEGLTPGQ
ncbi:sulfatase-like hydrolase/transferase [Billgrantia endophytica]|uniref:Phosphatidylglycerol--membrane-oligosaccharide glycerophosphotransferase n=1 Tax=Billgrantia endophytica TaxID=2033802 RepID=A0A2N7U2L7_9GAMM|nr:sulfatase-like hydrolase/transferase [Halomonas endophytica]PMR74685.1 phosphatidylglycerol--membrane-oligosaccharide glycerophosphotransferase [Halomonas endophytica]